MTRRAWGLGALVLFFSAGPVHAAATSVAFPDAGGGPRSIAMGGHLVALPIDDHAIESNPGRLVYSTGSASAQVDRLDPDLDLWRGRVGVALGHGPSAAEPLQLTKPRRMAFGVAIQGQGLTLIEGSAYREATLAGSIGWAAANFLATGATVRYQRATSDVEGAGASGFGVDLGLSMDLSDHFDLGLAVTDAFGRTTYEASDDEDRAARVTLGVATVRRRWFQAELDYVYQNNATSALAGGFEVHAVKDILDVRLGVSQELREPARTVPSAGLGFGFREFRFDYAYRNDPDGAFEHQHRVALGARF